MLYDGVLRFKVISLTLIAFFVCQKNLVISYSRIWTIVYEKIIFRLGKVGLPAFLNIQ